MNNTEIVNKICSLYGYNPEDVAKKKHGNRDTLSYGDIVYRLVAKPSTSISDIFPEISRTTITNILKNIFKDKQDNSSRWGNYLLSRINLKKCVECNEILDYSEYHGSILKNNLHNSCKKCYSTSNKDYYNTHKQERKDYQKDYYNSHKQERKEYHKEYYKDYYLANRTRLNLLSKEYAILNKGKYSVYNKKYYLLHKSKFCAYAAKYRSCKITRTPKWASLVEIEKVYLNRREGEHVDHIIPLQGELVSGLHCEHNLQYLPATINQSKGNKFDIDSYTHSITYTPPYIR